MKYKLINRRKHLIFFITFLLYTIVFLCFFLFIFINANEAGKIVSAIILAFCELSLTPYLVFHLHGYVGKIAFSSTGVYFKKRGKTFFISRSDVLIVNIRDDYFFGKLEDRNKIYIKIRKKGEKEFIPIMICQDDVIKTIINTFECRRNPQDFKFKWEKSKTDDIQ